MQIFLKRLTTKAYIFRKTKTKNGEKHYESNGFLQISLPFDQILEFDSKYTDK